jgi:hypothetical protein
VNHSDGKRKTAALLLVLLLALLVLVLVLLLLLLRIGSGAGWHSGLRPFVLELELKPACGAPVAPAPRAQGHQRPAAGTPTAAPTPDWAAGGCWLLCQCQGWGCGGGGATRNAAARRRRWCLAYGTWLRLGGHGRWPMADGRWPLMAYLLSIASRFGCYDL